MTPSDLTRQIKDAANMRGVSSYRLSELTGIAQPHIQRFYRGGNPTVKTLLKIAEALHLKVTISPD